MQKEDVRISHQTENQKENVGIDYVPGTYIGLSPFALALEGGLNSNPSRREEVILEDGKSETGPKQLRTWLTRSVLPHTGDQARSFEVDSAAPWQRAPPLDHVQVAAVRAAWYQW